VSISARRWRGAFEALRIREFRWLWLAGLASATTFQMGTVAQGWLVYELTGSALILGWVSTGWSMATLVFALYGGVIAERVDKRSIMLGARGLMLVNTLIIALLISARAIQVWHLLASSVLTGMAYSFIMPAQQAWIADLVDRRTLLNAAALSSVGMGLMGIFSAWAAGQIIESVGASGVYYAMAGTYVIALGSISRLPASGVRDGAPGSLWGDLSDGVRYLVHNPLMLALLVSSFARVLFAMPYRTFMPKFSSEIMGFDASGLGLLMAAPGVGALISSMVVASLGDFRRKGLLLIASGALAGGALVLFAGIHYLPLTLVFLALVGGGENNCMVVTNAMLQTYADPRYRARAMSMLMLVFGLSPAGTLPAGAIADHMGVPVVVGVQGALMVGSFAFVWLWRPELRRQE
jgi:MFS family permease